MKLIHLLYSLTKVKTKRLILLYILSLSGLAVQGQLKEYFEDDNISNYPHWSGESTKFIIENGRLRSQDSLKSGISYLSFPNQSIETAKWQIDFELKFNPSSSNYFDFVVVADQEYLSEYGGYFVRVGGSSDDISFYRKDGNRNTLLIDGVDDRVDFSSIKGSLRVLRDDNGNWQLLSNMGDQGYYQLEGEVFDDVYIENKFSGLICKYTATRWDKFYFDNLESCGNPFSDKISPVLNRSKVVSESMISLEFSEEIIPDVQNFILYPQEVNPTRIAVIENAVELSFAESFVNGELQSLAMKNVADLKGNLSADSLIHFRYIAPYESTGREIQLNEIMSDPTPEQGLPNLEYVELINTMDIPISLIGWQLCDTRKCAEIQSGFILPNQVVLLYPNSELVQPFTSTSSIIMENWPSLNNGGELLKLLNEQGYAIDSVDYDPGWLESDKREGGWSLEKRDPTFLCNDEANWTSSNSSTGGTPGYPNSVAEKIIDIEPPTIIETWVDASNHVNIEFSEPVLAMHPSLHSWPSLNFGPIVMSKSSEVLSSLDTLDPNVLYRIWMTGIEDCSGNSVDTVSTQYIAKTVLPEARDVLINEILSDPPPNGVDFIEIVNASNSFLDLYDLQIATIRDDSLYSSRKITNRHQLFLPSSYLALSASKLKLKDQYPSSPDSNFVETPLPIYPNEEGTVILLSAGTTIDSVHYNTDWHFELLDEVEGVSLERISWDVDSNDPSGWKSASSLNGYGTPGTENSQRYSSTGSERISVDPKVLIPGNPMQNSIVKISYDLGNGGWMTTVSLFSFTGTKVKSILSNRWTDAQGTHFWDGIMDNGQKAPIGIYLLLIQAFNGKGEVLTLRDKIYVGGY